MLRFIALPLVLLATSALHAQPGEPPIYSAPLQPLSPSKRGVVFKSKLARDFGRQCSRASPTGYWTSVAPSKNEIKQLEAALPRFVAQTKTARRSGKLSDFLFQYGALERGGKRLIYVNAFPDDKFSSRDRQVWRRGAMVVCDGGPSFWGAEWDTKTKAFQNMSFNGPY